MVTNTPEASGHWSASGTAGLEPTTFAAIEDRARSSRARRCWLVSMSLPRTGALERADRRGEITDDAGIVARDLTGVGVLEDARASGAELTGRHHDGDGRAAATGHIASAFVLRVPLEPREQPLRVERSHVRLHAAIQRFRGPGVEVVRQVRAPDQQSPTPAAGLA